MASCGTAHGKETRAKSAGSIRRAAPCSKGLRCRAAPASAGWSRTERTSFMPAAARAERSAPCDGREGREYRECRECREYVKAVTRDGGNTNPHHGRRIDEPEPRNLNLKKRSTP